MGNTPVPKFTYPGDDPELDRLLNEARIEGERDLTSFPDMFGRRKLRAGGEVDQDAATVPGSPWTSKGAGEIDKGALPSALMPTKEPAVSTRPGMAETPAGVPPKNQTRWLALGALTIIGPVAALALGVALHATKGPQGAIVIPPGMVSVAASAAPPVVSAAAPRMTAVPVIEEDAGAAPAVTAEPSGARPTVAPGLRTKVKNDPYDAAAPGPAKSVEFVVPPPPPATVVPSVPLPPPLPSTKPSASQTGPIGGPPQY
jgi:hypothetical protein